MIGNDPRMNSIGYSDKDHVELEAPSNNPQNTMLLGHEAKHLDITNKTVELHDGTVVKFDKCFIATGNVDFRFYLTHSFAEISLYFFPLVLSDLLHYQRHSDLYFFLIACPRAHLFPMLPYAHIAFGLQVFNRRQSAVLRV